jgi:hypothetical protein
VRTLTLNLVLIFYYIVSCQVLYTLSIFLGLSCSGAIDAAVALGYRPSLRAGGSRAGAPLLVTQSMSHLMIRLSDYFLPPGKDTHDLSMQRMQKDNLRNIVPMV